jgi:hypothetical protein
MPCLPDELPGQDRESIGAEVGDPESPGTCYTGVSDEAGRGCPPAPLRVRSTDRITRVQRPAAFCVRDPGTRCESLADPGRNGAKDPTCFGLAELITMARLGQVGTVLVLDVPFHAQHTPTGFRCRLLARVVAVGSNQCFSKRFRRH